MYGERRELIGQSSFSKALLKEKAADASGRSGGHGFRPLRRQLAHAELSRLDIKRRKEGKKRERKAFAKLCKVTWKLRHFEAVSLGRAVHRRLHHPRRGPDLNGLASTQVA